MPKKFLITSCCFVSGLFFTACQLGPQKKGAVPTPFPSPSQTSEVSSPAPILGAETETGTGAETKTNADALAATSSATLSATSKLTQNMRQTFSSKKLGISFRYKTGDKDLRILTKELGNKVYVYTDAQKSAEEGQSVEVFSKPVDLNLKDAVTAQFLGGISPTNCFVELTESATQKNITTAIINYPASDDGTECPLAYSRTNGLRYFWFDQNFPDKYVFFNIGQYVILGEKNQPWQKSFQFLP